MRWTSLAPLAALAASLLVTLVLLQPLFSAAGGLVGSGVVRWLPAATDLRTRRPVEGEPVRTLSSAQIAGSDRPRQYEAAFDLTEAPAGDIGVLALPTPAASRAYINGLRLEATRPGPRGDALLAPIPRDGLQRGTNRAHIIVPAAGPHRWPRAVLVGSLEPLRAAAARLGLIEHWSLRIVGVLGAAGALLGFLLAAGSRERRALTARSVLALLIAGLAAAGWFETESVVLLPWTWARLMLTASAALLALLTAASERDAQERRVTLAFRVAAAATALVAASGPLSLIAPDLGASLAHVSALAAGLIGAGVALGLAVFGQGVREAWSPDQRSIAALAALALLAATLSRVQAFGPWGLLIGQPVAGVAAVLFVVAWFVWIGGRAFLDAETVLRERLSLGRLVREQQARIAAQQAQLEAEIGRRAVLEERERFSRDIHDGIGGSLTSLLLRARTGDLKDADLESGLEGSLGDLRLMIDALDHTPASLAVAFSTLQTRLAPAFRAAGIALDWLQEPLDGHALRDSRSLLQVFRILQEAATNTVRHSGAASARVRIGWSAPLNALVAEVEDDGPGSAPGAAPGNGLRNMAERARRIGADLEVGPVPGGAGWRVRLQAPGV